MDYKSATVAKVRGAGAMFGPENQCTRCHHDFNPHIVVATTGDPREGGIILCQHKGCRCFATFGIPQLGGTEEAIHIPSMDDVEQIMREMQTEE